MTTVVLPAHALLPGMVTEVVGQPAIITSVLRDYLKDDASTEVTLYVNVSTGDLSIPVPMHDLVPVVGACHDLSPMEITFFEVAEPLT